VRKIEAIVPESYHPVFTFRNGFNTPTGVSACTEGSIEVRWKLIIAWKRICIVLKIYNGIRDGFRVVLGTHTNLGGKWNRFRDFRPALQETKKRQEQEESIH
jgi:hypothetical protein